jgi:cytochrome P450
MLLSSFAGSDTTAIALRSILYHLMGNSSALKKLQEELDKASKSGQLSSPVRYAEAIKLPYLVACCKEGMRIHPSVGMSLARHVPNGGCEIAGTFLPAGTRVGINAAVLHFDKGIFGEDAELFLPDRWFRTGAADMDAHMLHFGYGARTCSGKNVRLPSLLSVDLVDSIDDHSIDIA